jgi:hypothetical protein
MKLKITNRCSTWQKDFEGGKSQYCSINCEMLDISCRVFEYTKW